MRQATSSAMVEESVSGRVIGVAIVRTWHQIAFILLSISTTPFMLLSSLRHCRFWLSSPLISLPVTVVLLPPLFSLNLITLLYANYSSLSVSLVYSPFAFTSQL